VQTRAVIATGTVTVVDKDLAAVRENIDRLLGRYGGYVADEETQNDKNGVTQRSRLTVRIPYPAFDDVMNAFDDFTKVQSAHTKSEDVTTQVIDVNSRVKTQEASLRQLRAFLRRTSDIDTMVRLESEIAQREAALESMQAQASYLADQTSYATITVDMRLTPKTAPHKKPAAKHEVGFLTGLDNGWQALLGVLLVAATVVGALLPFALVVALIGFPTWLLLRRRAPRVESGA
jgi:hypothetical protein